MFQFVNYNFFADGNALDNAPSNVDYINTIRLTNAIYDHFNVTRDVNLPFSTDIPQDWDYDTVIDVDFNGNIDGGNVDFLINEITAVKIKRRKQGEFNWITLKTIPINNIEELNFAFDDFLNAYGITYEYAFVPILSGVEGNYIINSIYSQFNGIFIGDSSQIFKFLFNVQYGTNNRNQQTGTFQPLGRRYPVIVANGSLSYESGTVSGTILNDDFEDTRRIDPPAIVQKRKILNDFLTNKKAKILKDWSGNYYLCIVTGSPQTTYLTGSNMQIPQVQFNWVEIGDGENVQDLYNNGLLESLV